MIREIHEIIVWGEKYKIGDIKRSDFLLLYANYELAMQHILGEFNDTIPTLNERQTRELLNFLTESVKEKEPKKKPKKEENEKTREELERQFVVIESQLMQHLHQQLSEIRSRTLKYLMKVYSSNTSDKNDKLDKKSIKKYLGSCYENKSN
jgi:vacuolar-type H+-ATPase subunit F/Vma7